MLLTRKNLLSLSLLWRLRSHEGGKDSDLLRTMFGCDTDIVQILTTFRPDPEQELFGRKLVNNGYQTIRIRTWYEHSTKTTPKAA
ncbi:hypothetical protein [Sphingobacterium sp. WOUb80]|uniref:hypothetical protein n=1 Tax=Sphingobacterium sp. WOUb80 TaxID=3234028 RepID=UPI003CF76E31